MSLIKISSGSNVKILDKTRISTSGGGGGGGPEAPSAFWSGWSTEPSYTAGGTATFSTDGNVLKLTPRSGLTSFNSGYTYCGGVVDASDCSNLTTLGCYYNQLTSLDVSSNTALTLLDCFGNQLTSLDVSSNTALTQLYCSSNQLTSLDVSSNTALTILGCYYNQLTSLDVSSNTALTLLNCSNNQLTEASVNNILISINSFGTSNGIIYIHGGTNAAPTGAGLTAKAALQSRGWNVQTN